MSVLYYAGDGLFCYEMDMLNMAHIGEVLVNMGFEPRDDMNFPPESVNRDTALPPRWAHLAKESK